MTRAKLLLVSELASSATVAMLGGSTLENSLTLSAGPRELMETPPRLDDRAFEAHRNWKP